MSLNIAEVDQFEEYIRKNLDLVSQKPKNMADAFDKEMFLHWALQEAYDLMQEARPEQMVRLGLIAGAMQDRIRRLNR